MAAPERADLRELVGMAVNSSTLSMRSSHETALVRVAAVGAAALAVHHSADVENVATAGARSLVYGAPLDPRDVLAGELVPVLWHIRYGCQHTLVPNAVGLFAAWIVYRSIFSEYSKPEYQALRLAFSARAMHEWLSDRCTACGGSGKKQRSRTGQWVKPLATMQRNATFRPCDACSGSRREPVCPPLRMKALGVTRAEYDGQRWAHRFSASLSWLNQLLPSRLVRSLTTQLERRK